MEKKNERKTWKRGDGVTQKMMSFRLDSDLNGLMAGVTNKGRLINDLLREYFAAKAKPEDDDPAWGDIEDTQT